MILIKIVESTLVVIPLVIYYIFVLYNRLQDLDEKPTSFNVRWNMFFKCILI